MMKALEKIYEVDVCNTAEEIALPVAPTTPGDGKRPSVTRVRLQLRVKEKKTTPFNIFPGKMYVIFGCSAPRERQD